MRLILLLLFLPVLQLFSQSGGSYFPYYKAMSDAELSIVDLDFAKAYNIYVKTFLQFENHQKNDLVNASQCAILIGEDKQATEWIKELITKGAILEDFKSTIYKQLPQSEWNKVKDKNDSLREIYFKNYNISYKNILDTLRKREQRFAFANQQNNDSLLYAHAKILYKLISEEGIPRVAMFDGFKLPLDVLRHNFGLRNRLRYYKQCNIDTTTNLYKSMDFSCYDLESLLIKAVSLGELTPSFVATCMQYNELDSTRQLSAISLDVDLNTKIIKYYISSQRTLELINAYRASIGLESVQDAIQKDLEIKLLYNQETYPFDEVIRRYNEIGYSQTAMKSLKFGSEEFDKLGHAAVKIDTDIIKAYIFSKENFDVKSLKGEVKIHFTSRWELLKSFRFNPTVIYKSIIPPIK